VPTPTGLPRVGEVWELETVVMGDKGPRQRAVVLARSGGSYWALTVYIPGRGRVLWVDAPYHFGRGELRYIGPAGPETRKKLGL
jgi:hypothetical protein